MYFLFGHLGKTILLLDLDSIDQLDLLRDKQEKAGDCLLLNLQILGFMIIFYVNCTYLPIGTHAVWIYHFQKGRIVDFILDAFKAENDFDVLLTC